jgi:DNA polymerase (family 10)
MSVIHNYDIAERIKWYSQLSELHNGNPFKIKSYQSAAYRIERIAEPLSTLSLEQLRAHDGIGKSIADKVFEIINTGTFAELDELINQTPEGVQQLFSVKGIGPKKIAYIWNQLGIDSIGELLYACNENRLAQAKGFGLKTQESVKQSILFILENSNKYHYARAEKLALAMIQNLSNTLAANTFIEPVGHMRRKSEVIDCIELLVATDNQSNNWSQLLESSLHATQVQSIASGYSFLLPEGMQVKLFIHSTSHIGFYQLCYTGNEDHLAQLGINLQMPIHGTEAEIYTQLGMQFIEPELREGRGEVEQAKQHKLPQLITWSDLKGTLHNHTTYSDGIHSLEEMALQAKGMGLQYLGVCDHSQSAQYAGGLKPEIVLKQFKEIDALNIKLAPFKIFKGIESDILGDGSLDYEPELLAQFELIVASVHSNLKMTEEKAMMRLLKAIENPYTTILGHPTGRLLLMREGYPINHQKIIDACAANGVAIEINANPYRLDLDWRWIDYALQKGVWLCINPDAHEKDGYNDMHYGIHVARKGGLSANKCLNALSLADFESFLKQSHSKRP